VICTGEPAGSIVPPGEFWASTVPAGAVAVTYAGAATVSPAAAMAAWARPLGEADDVRHRGGRRADAVDHVDVAAVDLDPVVGGPLDMQLIANWRHPSQSWDTGADTW
jgi:hypothetical protein